MAIHIGPIFAFCHVFNRRGNLPRVVCVKQLGVFPQLARARADRLGIGCAVELSDQIVLCFQKHLGQPHEKCLISPTCCSDASQSSVWRAPVDERLYTASTDS